MNARRLLTRASSAGALLALTACGLDKPAPIVTVVSGGQSEYAEANVFCFEGQSLEAGDCAVRHEGSTEIEIRGGETVGVDVDKELADSGWLIELSDPAQGQQAQPQQSEPQEGHYFTFTAPNLPSGSTLQLTVRSLDEGGTNNGEWSFTLKPKR